MDLTFGIQTGKQIGFTKPRIERCNCINGHCVRKCDLEKQEPCINNEIVCVCSPEFGKISDTECQYCGCGMGFNCTFKPVRRGWPEAFCECPEGYRNEYARCRPNCSKERPCQNGGTCKSDGSCSCKRGTMGDLCEDVFLCQYDCRPRLVVDCVYDVEKEQRVCLCKNRSLVFNPQEQACKPCPCGNGTCYTEYERLRCNCNPGYTEFNGYCKRCDCGFNISSKCEFGSNSEKICWCNDGYTTRDGYCAECDCGYYKDKDNNEKLIPCKLEGNIRHCSCPEGYEEYFGKCRDIDECKVNNTCHPTAICINTEGSFICRCKEGYRIAYNEDPQPGQECEEIDECSENRTLCPTSDHLRCVNLPGTYKCMCESDYRPVSMDADPRKTECKEEKASWLPTIIVCITTVAIILLSLLMHWFLKRRSRQ
ncbi:uncharacterized protein CEXT_372741 [Caerostris extrusa]|uniref:EGF-like domain-containing protein n=1 Tax=Caerostris extrusa TaxID=172846 RepID=A0AAV4MMP5_CAEEX|nr:uncharacterized protein CEXT_372741 [Caerostris extrusa]